MFTTESDAKAALLFLKKIVMRLTADIDFCGVVTSRSADRQFIFKRKNNPKLNLSAPVAPMSHVDHLPQCRD